MRGLLRCCIAATILATPGSATPVLLNQWYAGLWNTSNQTLVNESDLTGFPATVADPGSNPWTFTAAFATHLIITDLGRDGDRFEVFDGASSLGLTSAPTDDSTQCGMDPDVCLTNAKFSHGDFTLAPGPHSITMQINTNASNSTVGNNAFKVTAAVPEPGSIMLFGGGVALMLFSRRYKRRMNG